MIPFTVDPDITKAHTLPSAWYRDRATYDHVVDSVLLPSWQFIASEAELATSTDGAAAMAYPVPFLPGSVNEPLVIIREGSATRVLSNVCTHRGNILVRKACTLREIRCMYHGRRFDSEGKCLFMPEFKEVEAFPSPADNLRPLEHGAWAGMHFARLKANGREQSPEVSLLERGPFAESPRNSPLEPGPLSLDSFESWASILMARLSFLPLNLAAHRIEFDRDFEINAHWALYVENYLEGFHIPFVHPGLNAQLEWNSYETLCEEHGVLQIGIARDGDVIFDVPSGHVDFGKRVAAYYYWMFPNTMINVYPWGISLNIILPQAIDRTIIRYRTFVWDESKYNTGAGSSLDSVEAEDDDVVEYQQQGMQSRIYDRGRYSPKREQGVHHFHRMLDGIIGVKSLAKS